MAAPSPLRVCVRTLGGAVLYVDVPPTPTAVNATSTIPSSSASASASSSSFSYQMRDLKQSVASAVGVPAYALCLVRRGQIVPQSIGLSRLVPANQAQVKHILAQANREGGEGKDKGIGEDINADDGDYQMGDDGLFERGDVVVDPEERHDASSTPKKNVGKRKTISDTTMEIDSSNETEKAKAASAVCPTDSSASASASTSASTSASISVLYPNDTPVVDLVGDLGWSTNGTEVVVAIPAPFRRFIPTTVLHAALAQRKKARLAERGAARKKATAGDPSKTIPSIAASAAAAAAAATADVDVPGEVVMVDASSNAAGSEGSAATAAAAAAASVTTVVAGSVGAPLRDGSSGDVKRLYPEECLGPPSMWGKEFPSTLPLPSVEPAGVKDAPDAQSHQDNSKPRTASLPKVPTSFSFSNSGRGRGRPPPSMFASASAANSDLFGTAVSRASSGAGSRLSDWGAASQPQQWGVGAESGTVGSGHSWTPWMAEPPGAPAAPGKPSSAKKKGGADAATTVFAAAAAAAASKKKDAEAAEASRRPIYKAMFAFAALGDEVSPSEILSHDSDSGKTEATKSAVVSGWKKKSLGDEKKTSKLASPRKIRAPSTGRKSVAKKGAKRKDQSSEDEPMQHSSGDESAGTSTSWSDSEEVGTRADKEVAKSPARPSGTDASEAAGLLANSGAAKDGDQPSSDDGSLSDAANATARLRRMSEQLRGLVSTMRESSGAASSGGGAPLGASETVSLRRAQPFASRARAAGVDSAKLSQLTDMGFAEPGCKRALLLHNNNVEAAMEWILVHSDEPEATAPLTEDEERALTGNDDGEGNEEEDGSDQEGMDGEAVVQEFLAMGLCASAEEAREALRAAEGDVGNATMLLASRHARQHGSAGGSTDGSALPSAMIASLVEDPTVADAVRNPRVLAALHKLIADPDSAMDEYSSDPEIATMVQRMHTIIEAQMQAARSESHPAEEQLLDDDAYSALDLFN